MRLVMIGAGGHGRAVLEVLRDAGWPDPVGVLDDDPSCPGLPGVPHLGPLAHAATLRAGGVEGAHVALGDNARRRQLGEELRRLGFALPAFRHPSAVIARNAALGPGSVAMPRVVLGAMARVGAHVILNTGCIVEHDCVVEEGCHVAPGAVLGGGVALGAGAMVGILAGIRPGRRIGAGAVIGMGAAVLEDVPAAARMGGVPARPLGRAGEG